MGDNYDVAYSHQHCCCCCCCCPIIQLQHRSSTATGFHDVVDAVNGGSEVTGRGDVIDRRSGGEVEAAELVSLTIDQQEQQQNTRGGAEKPSNKLPWLRLRKMTAAAATATPAAENKNGSRQCQQRSADRCGEHSSRESSASKIRTESAAVSATSVCDAVRSSAVSTPAAVITNNSIRPAVLTQHD
jgi:hypothetical protein